MRRGRLGFALGVVFWARAGLALDDAPRVALGLTRADGTDACMREHAIERAVERRLRRHVFVDTGVAELRIDVALGHGADGAWSATLVLRGPDGAELGARELETSAAHCSALDESLVLVVALLVDSPEARDAMEAAKARASAAETPRGTATPPPAAPFERKPPLPIELPSDTFAPRAPYRVELGASAAALGGALPGVPLGVELALGVRAPHFVEVRLRPIAFFPREVHAPAADRGGRFSLLAVGLDVCPLEYAAGRLRFTGCAGQRVGRVAASGFGFQETERASELYYALGASAGGLFWFAPPLGVALEFGAEAPLTHDAYFSRGPGGERRKIFQASPLAAGASAGIVLSL